LRFGSYLAICSKGLCCAIYERKLKFPGTRKGDEAGLGEIGLMYKEVLSKPGIEPGTLQPRSIGNGNAFLTSQSDSHSQQVSQMYSRKF
jgi:hypothetical protein